MRLFRPLLLLNGNAVPTPTTVRTVT
jgi:hypothetical protein